MQKRINQITIVSWWEKKIFKHYLNILVFGIESKTEHFDRKGKKECKDEIII